MVRWRKGCAVARQAFRRELEEERKQKEEEDKRKQEEAGEEQLRLEIQMVIAQTIAEAQSNTDDSSDYTETDDQSTVLSGMSITLYQRQGDTDADFHRCHQPDISLDGRTRQTIPPELVSGRHGHPTLCPDDRYLLRK